MIISNSSPLINLAAINHFNLLKELYFEISIPEAVWEEVVIKGKGQAGSSEVERANWIKKEKVKDATLVKALMQNLERGEAETVALAVERKSKLILLDEKFARDVASSFSLNYIGVVGILKEAKSKNLIKSMKRALDDLRRIAGFWVSDDLYEEVLKGED